jgi:Domain of unknown function (DUF4288)
MQKERWFSAKCIFTHSNVKSEHKFVYEERIVVIRGRKFDDAIRKAEKEAGKYAAALDGCCYIGYVDVYELFTKQLRSGSEVYSLMRDSNLPKNRYLDRYYDTGKERYQK